MIGLDVGLAFTDEGARLIGPFSTVDSALAAIQDVDIDFAVLDFLLRGETCERLAHELKARGVPFVFVTGVEGSRIGEVWSDVPVLQKPINPCAITRMVGRMHAA